ncbi:beta-1,3-galactosyltransferase 1-like [Glandiceps talaboti]
MSIMDRLYVRLLLLSLLPLLNLILYLYFMRPNNTTRNLLGGVGDDKRTNFGRVITSLLKNTSDPENVIESIRNSMVIEACNTNNSCLSQYLHNRGFPKNVNFLLSNPYKCENIAKADSAFESDTNTNVFLLALVSSRIVNFEHREAIRQTWGKTQNISQRKVITLFLIGNTIDHKMKAIVKRENEEYDDIIMGDFIDSYHNLTLKIIMGFKWVKYYCPHAKFILKADDDVYVNYANLINFLSRENPSHFAAGHVYLHQTPNRNSSHKWYMSNEIFPATTYPPFCSGTGYVMSFDVVRDTYELSLSTALLPLEDVYVGVCWSKLGIVPKNYAGFRVSNLVQYPQCMYHYVSTIHEVTPRDLYEIWNYMQDNKQRACNQSVYSENIVPLFSIFL